MPKTLTPPSQVSDEEWAKQVYGLTGLGVDPSWRTTLVLPAVSGTYVEDLSEEPPH